MGVGPDLRLGTLVYVTSDSVPKCRRGKVVENRRKHGGYLVLHEGDEPGPFGWGDSELSLIPKVGQVWENDEPFGMNCTIYESRGENIVTNSGSWPLSAFVRYWTLTPRTRWQRLIENLQKSL